MVVDNIKNKEIYYGLHPNFKKAFDFIEKALKENREVAKYEIDGKNVYAFIQEYEGKKPHEKFEGHKNYIDIQFIASGKEIMECAEIDGCKTMTEYNPEKDVAFYTCNGIRTKIEAKDGDFAIFFPNDIHKPGIKFADGIKVKKIVVKVLMA